MPIVFAVSFVETAEPDAAPLEFYDRERLIEDSVNGGGSDLIKLLKTGAVALHNRRTGRILLPLLAIEIGINISAWAEMIEYTEADIDKLMGYPWANLCAHEMCHSLGMKDHSEEMATNAYSHPLQGGTAPSSDDIQRIVDAILGDAPNEST